MCEQGNVMWCLGLERQGVVKCCGNTEEVEGSWGRFVEELIFELDVKGKAEVF